jgi:beta-phosphoglucomutase
MPAVGVIFDMDGVLLNSGPAHAESWRVLAREHGRTVSDEEFARHFGKPSRDIIRALFGRQLTDEEVRRLDDRKEAVYRELIRDALPVMPGALSAIERLSDAGLSLAVGSSGPPENIDLMLDGLEIRERVAAVVHGKEVTHGKPHSEVFLLAATRLGIPPERCVVIEDAPVGIEAAHRARMPTVGLTSTHARDALGSAEVVIDSLDELHPALIAKLLAAMPT